MLDNIKENRYDTPVTPAPWFSRLKLKEFCGSIKGLNVCEPYFFENKGCKTLK
ncbi:MAG: hypothetical protein LUH22_11220 [Bacteroides sp.]|nr:hypothetical protein [Bacteroides sp.]